MKITLIYDNEVYQKGLLSDWGFACLIEGENIPTILFDTGANGKILLENMGKLDISPQSVKEVFLSHSHWDHTGGLSAFLEQNSDVTLYLPPGYQSPNDKVEVKKVEQAGEIHDGIYTTGWLGDVEQSLGIRAKQGLEVVVGCSHSGVGNIVRTLSQFGDVHAVIGGYHGFREFEVLKGVSVICACHCTQFQSEIKNRYPEQWTEGGAGKVFTFED